MEGGEDLREGFDHTHRRRLRLFVILFFVIFLAVALIIILPFLIWFFVYRIQDESSSSSSSQPVIECVDTKIATALEHIYPFSGVVPIPLVITTNNGNTAFSVLNNTISQGTRPSDDQDFVFSALQSSFGPTPSNYARSDMGQSFFGASDSGNQIVVINHENIARSIVRDTGNLWFFNILSEGEGSYADIEYLGCSISADGRIIGTLENNVNAVHAKFYTLNNGSAYEYSGNVIIESEPLDPIYGATLAIDGTGEMVSIIYIHDTVYKLVLAVRNGTLPPSQVWTIVFHGILPDFLPSIPSLWFSRSLLRRSLDEAVSNPDKRLLIFSCPKSGLGSTGRAVVYKTVKNPTSSEEGSEPVQEYNIEVVNVLTLPITAPLEASSEFGFSITCDGINCVNTIYVGAPHNVDGKVYLFRRNPYNGNKYDYIYLLSPEVFNFNSYPSDVYGYDISVDRAGTLLWVSSQNAFEPDSKALILYREPEECDQIPLSSLPTRFTGSASSLESMVAYGGYVSSDGSRIFYVTNEGFVSQGVKNSEGMFEFSELSDPPYDGIYAEPLGYSRFNFAADFEARRLIMGVDNNYISSFPYYAAIRKSETSLDYWFSELPCSRPAGQIVRRGGVAISGNGTAAAVTGIAKYDDPDQDYAFIDFYLYSEDGGPGGIPTFLPNGTIDIADIAPGLDASHYGISALAMDELGESAVCVVQLNDDEYVISGYMLTYGSGWDVLGDGMKIVDLGLDPTVKHVPSLLHRDERVPNGLIFFICQPSYNGHGAVRSFVYTEDFNPEPAWFFEPETHEPYSAFGSAISSIGRNCVDYLIIGSPGSDRAEIVQLQEFYRVEFISTITLPPHPTTSIFSHILKKTLPVYPSSNGSVNVQQASKPDNNTSDLNTKIDRIIVNIQQLKDKTVRIDQRPRGNVPRDVVLSRFGVTVSINGLGTAESPLAAYLSWEGNNSETDEKLVFVGQYVA